MAQHTSLSRDEIAALPKYTDIRIRRSGRKTWQLACTTSEAREVAGSLLLQYSYAYSDRGEVVLRSGSHTAIIGALYPDEIARA